MEWTSCKGEGRHKACPYRWLRGEWDRRLVREGEGRHKACPYRWLRGEWDRRLVREGEGRHKACPYRGVEGVAKAARKAARGQAQGLPLAVVEAGMG